ncbi:MAG: RagB/SusD family nutrient uptake outer membrane protein [Paramuribaculum sp.]|nr:RagB/SusD family nutrient uptake outer membrane protein [Paramuribaculum sp.]
MKLKYISIPVVGFGLLGLSSCMDTLDTHPTTDFPGEQVWGSKSTAEAFIQGTYNVTVQNAQMANSGSCVAWAARTPDGVRCSQVGEGIDGVATELGLSANTDMGISMFGNLRRCNLIIEKVTESSSFTEGEKNELIAHGRFLRGLIFYWQTKSMGRFVPVRQVFTEADSLKADIPMTSSVAESYKLVMEDFDAAIPYMPVTALPGLPTKYAAEVIASRACLQAYAYTGDASYLDKAITYAKDVTVNGPALVSDYAGMFNETNATAGEILWGYYRLTENTTIQTYEEMIRTFPNVSVDDLLLSKSPNPFIIQGDGRPFEAWAIYFPTQDLVDQYLAIDEATGEAKNWWETSQYLAAVTEHNPLSVTTPGEIDKYERTNGEVRQIPEIQDFLQLNDAYPAAVRYGTLNDPDSDKDISDIIYGNRDARMAGTIVYDKVNWLNQYCTTNLAGNLSMGVRDKADGGWYNTTTGYYWRKNSVTDIARAYLSRNVPFHFCIARSGEAYLNLAEAYLCKGDVANAVAAFNNTRTVHGKLPASTASTLKDAWADYMRERRVEMACEANDIYFSYLRWGKYGGDANYGRAPGDIIRDLDCPVYKIEINRDRTAFIINQMTLLNSAQRHFTTRRYLFPIPQGFLNTREAYGLDHQQNPEW